MLLLCGLNIAFGAAVSGQVRASAVVSTTYIGWQGRTASVTTIRTFVLRWKFTKLPNWQARLGCDGGGQMNMEFPIGPAITGAYRLWRVYTRDKSGSISDVAANGLKPKERQRF